MGLYLKSYNGTPDPVNPWELIAGNVDGELEKTTTSEEVIIGQFLMREHKIESNYNNVYFVYDARLSDGDTHSWGRRLKPSEIRSDGGDNPEFGDALRVNADTLKKLRYEACLIFANREKEIHKK